MATLPGARADKSGCRTLARLALGLQVGHTLKNKGHMAEIALRTYVKEIDEAIEQEQLDQAIALCRHVLETYPKNLETYRLLGKAYLEAKRYGDAADLFQRVLSAVPDDFVAHVGMSIVREDEGNLDASIWHMERAFETNPANPTIQQELRRLIGRRDGLEPHKVRLTRGALARMYAHGELYQQAVAELRSALNEDPERPDLQVLLASLYWRMNQRQEATGVSLAILEKLPFCREANRIMATSLQAADKIEEAAAYHRRLAALDPYAAFVQSAMIDPVTVDAASVRLEKLAWSPGQALSPLAQGRPDWAASLGAELRGEKRAPAPVNMPSWIDSQPSPEPVPVPAPRPPGEAVHPFAGAKAPPEAPIPEWMQDAGWHPSKGEAVEGPVSFTQEELEGKAAPEAGEAAQPLAPAEMPGWLQEIAPPSEPDLRAADAPATPAGSGMPDWMKDVQPMAIPAAGSGLAAAASYRDSPAPASGPEATAEGGPEAAAGATAEGLESAELPTWLDDAAPGASETIVYWLGDRTKPGASEAQEPAAGEPEGSPLPEGAPNWLEQAASEEIELEAKGPSSESASELPGWLSGVATAAAHEPEQAQPAEPIAWLDEAAEQPSEPEFDIEAPSRAAAAEEAPDWLRSILKPETEEAGADSGLGELPPSGASPEAAPSWLEAMPDEEPASEAPDWLSRLSSPDEPSVAGEQGAQPSEAAPGSLAAAAAAAASDDWLRGILDSSESEEPGAAEDEAQGADWLQGLYTEPSPKVPTQPEPEAADITSDDWLRSMVPEPAEDVGVEPSFELEQPEWLERLVSPDSAVEPGAPQATPDWVLALAGMGPAAETEATPPEEMAAPEWLGRVLDGVPPEDQGLVSKAPVADLSGDDTLAVERPPWMKQTAPDTVASGPGTVPAVAALGALREFTEAEPLPPERPAPPRAAEPPDWLREFADAAGDETPPPTTRSAPPAPSPPDLEYEGALDWLREGETGPMAAEGVGLPPASVAAVARTPAGDVDDEEIFRWLDDLAQRQDTDAVPSGIVPRREIEPPGAEPAPRPEARAAVPDDAETGLEWLEQLAGGQEQAPTVAAAASPAPTEAIPAGGIPAPAPAQEVTPVEPSLPAAPEPERPAPPLPETEEEDITEWLKTLSMTSPSPETEPVPAPAAAVAPPIVAPPAPPERPAQVPVTQVQPPPGPEEALRKPTWTPVDEDWLQPAPPPAEQPAPAAVEPQPVVAEPRPSARPAAPSKPKTAGPADVLARARQHLSKGDFAKASKDYSTVIKKKYELDTVITELQMAAEHFPSEAGLWQLLGDAYMRAERLEEAVGAYNRGMTAG